MLYENIEKWKYEYCFSNLKLVWLEVHKFKSKK